MFHLGYYWKLHFSTYKSVFMLKVNRMKTVTNLSPQWALILKDLPVGSLLEISVHLAICWLHFGFLSLPLDLRVYYNVQWSSWYFPFALRWGKGSACSSIEEIQTREMPQAFYCRRLFFVNHNVFSLILWQPSFFHDLQNIVWWQVHLGKAVILL